MEQRSRVVRQNPSLLDSADRHESICPTELTFLEPEHNVQNRQGQTHKTWCEISTWTRAAWGTAAPRIIHAHGTLCWAVWNSGPRFGCTVMLITHRRECYKEREVEISSLCFFPSCTTTEYWHWRGTSICFTEKKQWWNSLSPFQKMNFSNENFC